MKEDRKTSQKTQKKQYKVRNWPEYDRVLVQIGSMILRNYVPKKGFIHQSPPKLFVVETFSKEFVHIASFSRKIPNKPMPLQNSPSNIQGQKDETMQEERIIILQKVKSLL